MQIAPPNVYIFAPYIYLACVCFYTFTRFHMAISKNDRIKKKQKQSTPFSWAVVIYSVSKTFTCFISIILIYIENHKFVQKILNRSVCIWFHHFILLCIVQIPILHFLAFFLAFIHNLFFSQNVFFYSFVDTFFNISFFSVSVTVVYNIVRCFLVVFAYHLLRQYSWFFFWSAAVNYSTQSPDKKGVRLWEVKNP